MLNHPTLEKLSQLKLYTMARTLQTQMEMPEYTELGFEERLGLLVDCEMTAREEKRLQRRLGSAKLRQNACMEDIDFGSKRGLDKSLILNLATCHWVAKHRNILITGPTGAGKSWLACALGNKACREGYSVSYKRSLRLFNELSLARVDGTLNRVFHKMSKTDVLIIDDWGLNKLTTEQRRDMLELMEDRYDLKSTIITSQLPIDQWHESIGDTTLADAILDRLVHNAYKIKLEGESLRKKTDLTER